MKKSAFIVGPQTAQMLQLGHPWVLADRYTRKWPKGNAGDLIQLADEAGRFLATALLDPADRVVARVLDFAPMDLDQNWVHDKVQQALELRQRHLALDDTDAYRLINGEGDFLPGLTVDKYGDYLMVQLFSRAWRPHLPLLVSALQKALEPVGIYEKFRPQQTRKLADKPKKLSHLLWGQGFSGRLKIKENGLTLLVELEEGLNTGLFSDQRDNRRDLMARAAGARVLNLFAYTGAFSVAAAAAGAAKVTSVDASAPYLEWARANFEANRLNPKRHEFLVGDCRNVLKDLQRQGRSFDVIIMDPPSFSTVKKSRFTTSGGTSDLVSEALPLLEKGGVLITSSNHQKVDLADYLKELRRGALAAGATLRVIGNYGQAGDFPYPVTFPEGRYLKYLISVKG
ncbi:SAM-dependent methyltransferase, putative [Syntrophotalea carbinolica DSM 2380]|uniref:SAM-dependent methyltransferase, putative n=1 Tax=Syntrophotalea carbinolica (strain DSM 2380 / NBRC 103641 / GraBd1) TaxID=338963 RepID=Q3A5N9_SYNC1|nr:class I SAM-dependent rRNA methyltransferase [Syntrophotalea carbinolica]ABA88318.1 SAM-dependent methyltransferase, putative [Syntrophotalea carbinolica DSM 2380]